MPHASNEMVFFAGVLAAVTILFHLDVLDEFFLKHVDGHCCHHDRGVLPLN